MVVSDACSAITVVVNSCQVGELGFQRPAKATKQGRRDVFRSASVAISRVYPSSASTLRINVAGHLNEELFLPQFFQSPECIDGFSACAKRVVASPRWPEACGNGGGPDLSDRRPTHPGQILVSFR